MPGKEYWRFQVAGGLFEGLYRPGQSLEESISQLNKQFPTKVGNFKLVMEAIRTKFPEYTITPKERAEAPKRREISALARRTMFTNFHRRLEERSLLPKGQTMERGFEMLFDYSGGEGAKEWNDRVRFLFAKEGSIYPNGSKEERGKLLEEYIDRLGKTDFERLHHLSDRELAAEFGQMYPLLTFLSEAGDSLLPMRGTAYTLPDEYMDKIMEMRESHQLMMGSLRGRFEYLAQPEYEILPYERIRLQPGQDTEFYEYDPDIPPDVKTLDERIREDSQVNLFIDCAFRQDELFRVSILERVNHEIRKLNLPQEMLNPPVYNTQGAKVSAPLLDLSLPDGTALSAMELHPGQTICFTNPQTNQQNFLWSDGRSYTTIDFSTLPAPIKNEPEKLLKTLEDADPWYIRKFTGSQFYEDLKQSIKDVKALTDSMSDTPSKEEREELWDKLEKLEKKNQSYLESKVELSKATKESERLRISAATGVKKYIEDTRLLLGTYDRAVEKANANKKEAEVKQETKLNFYLNEAADFYKDNLEPDDPMANLGDRIYESLKDGNLPEKPLELITQMVAFDLVMRERYLSKNGGEIGAVEARYRKDPEEFVKGLEQSKVLQDKAAEVQKFPELFREFVNSAVGTGGIQGLTREVIGEQVRQAQQSAQLQQSAQVQNKAPEAEKPPTAPIF